MLLHVTAEEIAVSMTDQNATMALHHCRDLRRFYYAVVSCYDDCCWLPSWYADANRLKKSCHCLISSVKQIPAISWASNIYTMSRAMAVAYMWSTEYMRAYHIFGYSSTCNTVFCLCSWRTRIGINNVAVHAQQIVEVVNQNLMLINS